MSYQEKLDSALKFLNEHNEVLGKESPATINTEQFIASIKAMGATSEDRLKAMSYEDILECLPTHNGKQPKILAKGLAGLFRGKDVVVGEKRPVGSRKAEQMTNLELIESYDPEDATSPVSQRLLAISKGEPFVVYTSGRQVDVTTTHKLLTELKFGLKGRSDIVVHNEIKKVFKIGELNDNFADENPLYHNRPLRPDGTCDQTGRSWDGVAKNIRQLVWLAVSSGELVVNIETAHATLDAVMAEPNVAWSALSKKYRKSALKFATDTEIGTLPNLKISLGNRENPLKDGKQVIWKR